MLPLVKHVRQASCRAARLLSHSTHPVRELRTTVHSGEDFVHLLGGLRRIAESVKYLDLNDGDRIGHGVALGADPDDWSARASGLMIPRGERLFDLLWAWDAAMQSGSSILHASLPWIEHEVGRLSYEIFLEEGLSLTILANWVWGLHSQRHLLLAGFPTGRGTRAWEFYVRTSAQNSEEKLPFRLLRLWLCSREVFDRANELEPISVSREVGLVSELQSSLRAEIGRRGVVVEINPSSNLLIGNLGELTKHPLWRMCPPVGGTPGSWVRICIGSDDPITFATRLPEEYQLLWDAMVSGGLSGQDADSWLDRARHTGLASRFTVPRSDLDLRSYVGLERVPIIP